MHWMIPHVSNMLEPQIYNFIQGNSSVQCVESEREDSSQRTRLIKVNMISSDQIRLDSTLFI